MERKSLDSKINQGQVISNWNSFWGASSPLTEIQMWDYYGGRPWILKYVPRHGKILEAGCGLGRYNFYLSEFGIDIEGMDFSPEVIEALKTWEKLYDLESVKFLVGDVCSLPYEDNSLSGMISLGVIEHFVEGPAKPLSEVNRVMRPGGIAIITTPAPSWSIIYQKSIENLKNRLRPLLGKEKYFPEFFQYWYSTKDLERFISDAGLQMVRTETRDTLYPYHEFRRYRVLDDSDIFVRLLTILDNYSLPFLGGQSLTLSIKKAEIMYCFLCGEYRAGIDSLTAHEVPLCVDCLHSQSAQFYLKGRPIRFNSQFLFNPPLQSTDFLTCEYCQTIYSRSPIFEDYGFTKKVCKSCLMNDEVNIELSNLHIQPIWRKRIK